MPPLPAQSYVRVNVNGAYEGFHTTDTFQSEVTAALSAVPLDVSEFLINVSDTFMQAITFQWLHHDYQATITVKTLNPAASVDDVVASVVHGFADVAGQVPASFGGTVVDAITVAPVTPAAGGMLGSLSHALGLDGVADAINTDVSRVLIGVFVLILVLVFVIGYGPNIKKLSTISL